jgi:hypothetical protein|tara:strand:+ start:1153 stop:1638 length:486 start_codon:yes stop_codon:yes gene_type:complete
MIEWVILSLLAYNFPSYFDTEQELNAAVIIDKAIVIKEDPYLMVSIAWVESRLKAGRVSKTGDYGLFQINYNFWGGRWGYKDRNKFLVDMSSANQATIAAAVVLQEMRRYKQCQGLNLPACYNGGPAWQKSKNIEKIIAYANKVNHMRGIFQRKFPGWRVR